MHSSRDLNPHYAPASVGGLMDPAFLRGAVGEFGGDRPAHHGAAGAPRRWLAGVGGLVMVSLRRFGRLARGGDGRR